MARLDIAVRGLRCGHCVDAVTRAFRARDPAAQVEVDLPAGLVRANSVLPAEDLARLLAAEGYPPV